ncbi:MAG: response regulator [Verrucomicrobia bacterium]|nr:response regulator [Verrucomicrobiota bacterium]
MNWLPFGKRNRPDLVPQTTSPADNQPAAACQKKILIVDDDAVIVKTTSAKLKSNGYQAVGALDAAEAVSAVRQHKPDLILLDISFPPDVGVDWDGFKIMAWLQHMDEARNIPVIIITGGDPEKYKDRSLATGAVAFFNKPINHNELLTVIARVLSDESRRAARDGA